MRAFLPWLAAIVFLLASGHAAADELRPNIVVLYADDMGYGDLASQNPESKIPTPHLDKLAAEGTRFTDAHSSASICTPSRYALLTGKYHWRKLHGIVGSFEPPVIDAAELTLPELLRQHGYRTACIGKWHLGWRWNAIKREGAQASQETGYAPEDFDWSQRIPGGPLDHGFDYYFGDDIPNFPPYAWIENDRLLTRPSAPLSVVENTNEGRWEARPGPMTDGWDFRAVMPRLTERAATWVREQKSSQQPFFLYVPFTSPHAPIVPTERFTGRSKAGGYGDYVAQTDDAVGTILNALDNAGLRDNTLVVFSADNGPEQYAYERIRKYEHRSAGPLRGLKRDLWEGGHRVPFVVRWPGKVQANAVSDGLISQVDLFATLAAAAGIETPSGAAPDSLNNLPTWKGKAPSPRRTIVHCSPREDYAIRHDDWVLIAARTGGVSKVPKWFDERFGYSRNNQHGELYNLRTDLAERKNLYDSEAEKVAELQARLNAIRGAAP